MTSLLTREEMHNRVDAVFDSIEEQNGEDAIAVIGGKEGSMNVNSPTEADDKDVHKARLSLAWAGYVFGTGALEVSESLRHRHQSNMLSTLVVPRSSTSQVVQDAVFEEVEEARDALAAGKPEQYTEADD